MEIETLQISPEEVEKELHTLQEGIKEGYISKQSKLVRDLLAIYGHLKHKNKIINVFEAFSKSGLNEAGHPKLAIVRADSAWCHLYKQKNGGAIFSTARKDQWNTNASFREGDINLPRGSFDWNMEALKEDNRFRTVSPMIPPRISVAVSARVVPYHYHILFEAEHWSADPEPPRSPRDPILGRMITPNIMAIEATWELTEIEQAVLVGKLSK